MERRKEAKVHLVTQFLYTCLTYLNVENLPLSFNTNALILVLNPTKMATKKLFLIDAFAIVYRAYFAFGSNQRYNSQGLNTSATLGFTNTVLEVLKKENPTHIGVVFDSPGPTFREEFYPQYKANRDAMPEDIRKALPYIKQIVSAMDIPILALEGYEADDIMGTLSKKAEKEGFEVYLMTPDKDFAQLVSENIFLYRPGRSGKPAEKWGIPEVKNKFEVERPEQVIDILGLWGDAVDNIPGIPGIGEKTSKALIAKYGSVEGLLAHTEDLKGKQKENVINFSAQGLLSRTGQKNFRRRIEYQQHCHFLGANGFVSSRSCC